MGFRNLKNIFGSGKKNEKNIKDAVNEPNEKIESVAFSNESESTNMETSEDVIGKVSEVHNDSTQAPTKNFKYLDDLIHSGVKEIVLDSDIVLTDEEESEYGEGIELDVNNLVIDGNGYSVDAKSKTRIFYCIGKNIVLKNIILKNGIYYKGAAIYNKRGDLTISESTFKDNGEFDSTDTGGAIYNLKGKIKIIKSTFDNNAAFEGGVIYNDYGSLTISQSSFYNNESNFGTIFNIGGRIVVKASKLNNKGFDEGSEILNWGGIKMHDCQFSTKEHSSSVIGNCGKGSLQVYDSTFMDNNCSTIIENKGLTSSEQDFIMTKVGIFNCKFSDNSVDSSLILNEGKSFHIERTIFENNNFNGDSYAIVNATDLTLTNPKIKDAGKILNDGHIIIKNSPEIESIIYNNGDIEKRG